MRNRGLWIAAAVIVIVAAWGGFVYNRLVTLNEAVPAAWSQVENVLQRRFDLIPNLVRTVRGYMKHERELLTEITRLRSQWGAARTTTARVEAANGLEGALARLMVLVERYPDLKANEGFLRLQDELAGTENRIAVERMRYNEAVRGYNIYTRRFPNNIVAGIFGFTRAPLFEAPEEAKQPPKVKF